MENISAFEYSKLKLMNEEPSKVISWITILLILLCLFILFSIFFKYNLYEQYPGIIELNDHYNVKLYVDKKIFPLKKNYKMYLDDKKIKYSVYKINDTGTYYELFLDCQLDDNLLINNNLVTIKIKKRQTTLLKEIIRKIRKG